MSFLLGLTIFRGELLNFRGVIPPSGVKNFTLRRLGKLGGPKKMYSRHDDGRSPDRSSYIFSRNHGWFEVAAVHLWTEPPQKNNGGVRVALQGFERSFFSHLLPEKKNEKSSTEKCISQRCDEREIRYMLLMVQTSDPRKFTGLGWA